MFRISWASAARLAALSIAGSVLAAAPARADDTGHGDHGLVLQINDGLRVSPDGPQPDSVSAGTYGSAPGMWNVFPATSVYRGGALIAGGIYDTWTNLDDLHDGDTIVVHDLVADGQPELGRYAYKRALGLDGPVCAGSTTYSGSRTPGSLAELATSAQWVPSDGDDDASNDYPFYGSPLTTYYYPGGAPGWQPTDTSFDTITGVGSDRISYTTTRPLVAGMHVTLSEFFWATPTVSVSESVTQAVVDCPAPAGGGGGGVPTPTPSPVLPTPASSPVTAAASTTAVAKDVVAPTVALVVPTRAQLVKLHRAGVVKSGVPVDFTVSEPGTVTASIAVVKGQSTTKIKGFNLAVKAGSNPFLLRWSRTAQRVLTAAPAGARLAITVSETDAAGNRSPVQTSGVRLPR